MVMIMLLIIVIILILFKVIKSGVMAMMMKPAVMLQYLRELVGQGAPAELAVLL